LHQLSSQHLSSHQLSVNLPIFVEEELFEESCMAEVQTPGSGSTELSYPSVTVEPETLNFVVQTDYPIVSTDYEEQVWSQDTQV
jgi:hypothetical protein